VRRSLYLLGHRFQDWQEEMNIARTFQKKWTVKYYASNGQKYLISLLYNGFTTAKEDVIDVDLPVTLIEGKDDTIKACFANPSNKNVYPSIPDFAFAFCSTVTDFTSIEESN
jgi:hypothetical protein